MTLTPVRDAAAAALGACIGSRALAPPPRLTLALNSAPHTHTHPTLIGIQTLRMAATNATTSPHSWFITLLL
eukprot:scaffold152627_cov27-Tisochrysis_lutea.AAC.5